jgi:hypothetical protein
MPTYKNDATYVYTHRLNQGMSVRRVSDQEDAQFEGVVEATALVQDSLKETSPGRYAYQVLVTFKDGSEVTTANRDRWEVLEA